MRKKGQRVRGEYGERENRGKSEGNKLERMIKVSRKDEEGMRIQGTCTREKDGRIMNSLSSKEDEKKTGTRKSRKKIKRTR